MATDTVSPLSFTGAPIFLSVYTDFGRSLQIMASMSRLRNEEIGPLEAAIRTGQQESKGSGRPEAVLRQYVQEALSDILHARGVRSAARDEVTLVVPSGAEAAVLDAPLDTAGRADAIYNRFVIEFEPPGSLRPSVGHLATKHAVTQVQQYLRGIERESGLPLERLAGCAFDGSWIVYVIWERGGWRISRPQRSDRSALSALVDTLESLASGRGLISHNLSEDFGRESEVAGLFVRALASLFKDGTASGRALSMFDQWRLDLGNASGPFSSSDLAEWQVLCSQLGVPQDDRESSYVLFALQTYFALVAKLLALVILEGATGEPLIEKLSADDVSEGFRQLEAGLLASGTKAINVIEPGVFSWYASEKSPAIKDALACLVKLSNEYSAEIVEITPLVARDVLKDLFQSLLPRSIRHRLGEYYTPDWLSQRVINQVTGSLEFLQPGKRVLDPACGSGTFLVEVISRMIATAGDKASLGTLEKILDNVVGFDLSPLAVQASKVNYLLALAPLIRHAREPFFIPVFLADSVSPPRRAGLLEGDVYILETSEGDWRIPVPLAEARYLPLVGSLIAEGIQDKKGPHWLRGEILRRLPLAEAQDQGVLDELDALYQKMTDLDDADRNGMWWQLLSNAFAPTLMGTFDYIVGNPPWVSWETLPERYRRANDALWTHYKLRPDSPSGRRQSSEQVRLDLSMLFVARCMDRYLSAGGKLGFVITASVFKSELAGRGFRRRHLPPSGAYRFVHIDDMSNLQIFEGATNQTAVLIADKKASSRQQIPVIRWTGSESRSIPSAVELPAAIELTQRRHFYGEPADPTDDSSPMLVMPRAGLEASRPLRHGSPYLKVIREGINTRGANGIFFVDVVDERDDGFLVQNLAAEGRNHEVPQLQGWVERGAVRKLLRGKDVGKGLANPRFGLLLFHDRTHSSHALAPGEVRTQFPLAFEYISQFETFLRARRRFRNFDPSGDDWLGIYSVTSAALAAHKVVVREIAQGMVAAPVHAEDVIPDHKLYVIPCSTEVEADYLSDVLNSRIVDFMLRSFSVSTSVTGSFLRYIGIRDLAKVNPPDDPEVALADALGLDADQFRLLDSIARTELEKGSRPPTESLRHMQQALVPDSSEIKGEQFVSLLPVYSLEAAAGYFGSGRSVELEGWLKVDGRLTRDMFVARAVGRSMEPRIADGDLCVFKRHRAGTKQSLIVLAQWAGPEDPETGGSYTVKKYSSEKIVDEDSGELKHFRITLSPLNPEFEPIVLSPEFEDEVQIIAELVQTLNANAPS